MNNLAKYLTINAIFFQLSGIGAILFSSRLNAFFNIGNGLALPILGLILMSFSIFILVVLRKYILNKTFVKIVSFIDVIWVIGSVVIVLLGLFNLSSNGYIAILIIAVCVAFLSYKLLKHNK